jgi:hypothetical protein
MSSSEPVIYETYSQKVPVPPRSRLFGLEPIGIGTPSCENLISYLVRLARAHCMSPRDLIRLEFMWRYSRQEGIRSSGFFKEYSKTLNSVGEYASGFVRIAEELNGRSDLRFLTMLPWRGVIPEVGTGLLAAEPKWCRQCLAEQRDSKQDRFSPLAWSLDLYRVCEKHGSRMSNRCPRCSRKQPFIPRLPMQDHCDYCGCSLGQPQSFDEVEAPTEREIWLAEAITDMISHGAYADGHVTQQSLQFVLSGFVADYADREKRQLSRMLGLTEASMACWITKGKKPLFPQLLDVCHQFGLFPTEFFSGVQPMRLSSAINLDKLYCIKGRSEMTANERTRLQTELSKIAGDPEDNRSLTEVSSALDATKNYLIYWFKDLCAVVSAKYREEVRRQAVLRAEIEDQIVRDAVAELCSAGIHPSRKKVGAAIRPLSLQKARLRRVFKEVVHQVKR